MQEHASELKEILSKITLADLNVAPDGKIVVADPEVAKQIAKLAGVLKPQDPVNGSGCLSGANTGCGKRAM